MADSYPSQNPYAPHTHTSGPPPEFGRGEKPGRGCFFWGCMIFLGLIVFGTVTVVGGGYYMYARIINTWTDDTPMEIAAVHFTPEEEAALNAEIKAYKDDKQPLRLNAKEINILAQKEAETKFAKFQVEEIKDGALVGKVSIILDEIGKTTMFKRLIGRYLNGRGKFSVATVNGRLDVRMLEIEINGEAPSESILAGMGERNLAENYNRERAQQGQKDDIESIEISGDELIITPKAGGTESNDGTGTSGPNSNQKPSAEPVA